MKKHKKHSKIKSIEEILEDELLKESEEIRIKPITEVIDNYINQNPEGIY